ncbi:MAG: hypothetical protein R2853_14315 [Thermomicrobiales bacterium]|nr:hypothetical protein [Thermomicrobiales bacterium]
MSSTNRDWPSQDSKGYAAATLSGDTDATSTEQKVTERAEPQPTARTCPWCDSPNVQLVQRGYAGLTDERDQFLICASCQRTTFEIVAKSSREMRMGRYKTGDLYQDRAQNTRYTISRVLRSGSNEFLLYLKPWREQPDRSVT